MLSNNIGSVIKIIIFIIHILLIIWLINIVLEILVGFYLHF